MSATAAATSSLKAGARRLVHRAGFDVVRTTNVRGGVDDFIPFEATLRAAAEAGLSVGDYIDQVMNGTPGATQATIDGMRAHGVFADDLASVLEVGPGSGRYLEKTLQQCAPDRYEIYETAQPWADYLVRTYGVISQPTTGCTLDSTPDDSIDLVQAHKVFNTITFLCASRYFPEMARVTRPGGLIVFDAMTETCLDPATVTAWAARGGEGHGSYPSALPRQVAEGLLATLGCHLAGSFTTPLGFASTEVLIFRKAARTL